MQFLTWKIKNYKSRKNWIWGVLGFIWEGVGGLLAPFGDSWALLGCSFSHFLSCFSRMLMHFVFLYRFMDPKKPKNGFSEGFGRLGGGFGKGFGRIWEDFRKGLGKFLKGSLQTKVARMSPALPRHWNSTSANSRSAASAVRPLQYRRMCTYVNIIYYRFMYVYLR